jgi:hypothetical protein
MRNTMRVRREFFVIYESSFLSPVLGCFLWGERDSVSYLLELHATRKALDFSFVVEGPSCDFIESAGAQVGFKDPENCSGI